MHNFVLDNRDLECMEASAEVERGGDAPMAERAAPDFLARIGGELKVTEPSSPAMGDVRSRGASTFRKGFLYVGTHRYASAYLS
ncbi:MAG: hypothetical protein JHC24_00175, partial [Thaumarchaeota archaeon]|nr:hypothetical protein [Nitrososphaerota archaeon]